MKNYQFTIEEEQQNERIDKCIAAVFGDLSRSYIQKLIKEERVLINGNICKANARPVCGNLITFSTPDAVLPDILPENIPLDILYEDHDLIIVNKPKGMVVHPAPGHYSGTLVNALLYHCGDELSGINGVMRPGIVHRIDMDTTGSVMACKNDAAHAFIAAQLKEHSINRKYVALVHGIMKDDTGRINAPIGRHPRERKKMAVNYKNGREAITNYRVLQRFKEYTLVECSLETGRTHQIRVHMASIHHPVVGDPVYCSRKNPEKLQGQVLHAKTLGFIHPSLKTYMEIDAPLPAYFERLLDDLVL
ncbi:MAG TPA: RluA family pseudouridine synthase [Lachnospiraceae bacterium]|nr:RluA family pseudouridine synthase [Lachnospiraceae bacterium]